MRTISDPYDLRPPRAGMALPAAIVLVMLAHLATLALPFVNQEFAFFSASQAFLNQDVSLLNELYFPYQANTLGVSLLAAGLARLLPTINVEYAPRAVSLLGLFLLAYSVRSYVRAFDRQVSASAAVLIVLANPLLWIYSSRGTADFFPVALGSFCIALYINDSSKKKWLPSALMGGLAMVMKYHAFFYPMLVIALLLQDGDLTVKRRLKYVLAYGAVSLTPLICYSIWTYTSFGIIIAPDQFREIHAAHLNGWIPIVNNLIFYLGFLSLLLMPVVLCVAWKLGALQVPPWAYAAVCAISVLGGVVFSPAGEMDLGPLARYLPASILPALCLASIALISHTIWRLLRINMPAGQHRMVAAAIVATVSFLIVLSLSRPAQRYLLLPLPIWLPILTCTLSRKLQQITGFITLFVSTVFCVIVFSQQFATGTAASNMVTMLRQHDLLRQTDPGAIEAHVMNAFVPKSNGPKPYIVVDGRQQHAIIVSEVRVLGPISRTYSLVSKESH